MPTIDVANTSADLTAKTLVTAEDDQDVSGEKTFNRAPAAPFAVEAGSAAVANLDADKLDGNHSTAFARLAFPNTLTDALTLAASFFLGGVISPAQIVANTDNYAPAGFATATVLRLSTDAARNLTGIAGGASTRVILIWNIGAQNLVLVHDATSTAANRFLCPGSANYTITANSGVLLWYDGVVVRWRVLGGVA